VIGDLGRSGRARQRGAVAGVLLAVKRTGLPVCLRGGVFYLLGQDATSWATGDVLRLAVGDGRAEHGALDGNIPERRVLLQATMGAISLGGATGIGLFAGAAVALDNWEGGNAGRHLGAGARHHQPHEQSDGATSSLTLAGTATDSGLGDSGIASVTVTVSPPRGHGCGWGHRRPGVGR